MFTDAQKTDIRRYCGFAVYGGSPTQAFGYRFFQHYGTLEFRMNNLQPSEETVVVDVYLTNLKALEAAIPALGANLDTDKAAIWERNKNEQRDRDRLFDSWRRRLCGFFGVPPGPELGDGGVSVVV